MVVLVSASAAGQSGDSGGLHGGDSGGGSDFGGGGFPHLP